MTIEEFEKKVKELFIQKKWNNQQMQWFIVEVRSFHHSKYVTAIRASDGKRFEGSGDNFDDAFANCLFTLESYPSLS